MITIISRSLLKLLIFDSFYFPCVDQTYWKSLFFIVSGKLFISSSNSLNNITEEQITQTVQEEIHQEVDIKKSKSYQSSRKTAPVKKSYITFFDYNIKISWLK